MLVCCKNCCGYLKPRLVSVFAAFVVLLVPFIQERTLLDDGTYYVSRYSPLVLMVAYIKLKEYYPLSLILLLSFVVYLVVSLLLLFIVKVSGCSKKDKKK